MHFVHTDTAQLYKTQSDVCLRTLHLAQGLFVFKRVFTETSVIMTSHMVVDTSLDIIHDRLASAGELRARVMRFRKEALLEDGGARTFGLTDSSYL